MATVECIALDGSTRVVEASALIVRPAAYAIIVRDGQLLLVRLKSSHKYHLPGGGVEPGEPTEETVRREVREETGLEIEVGPLAHYADAFFYYDPSGKAYHGLHSYYLCRPITTELLSDDQVEDSSAEGPRWVALTGLRPEQFQLHGEAVLAIANGRQP
jgi:8-oxo-dGTP pyrophosphatase MutT (NUDIX family)